MIALPVVKAQALLMMMVTLEVVHQAKKGERELEETKKQRTVKQTGVILTKRESKILLNGIKR